MPRLTVAIVVLALSLAAGGTLAADEPTSEEGTFSPAGSLAKTRGGETATLLPDGRVLILGGEGRWEHPILAEIWDPVTETFGPAGALGEARSQHTATPLPDGRVLVVGGFTERGTRDSAELWESRHDDVQPDRSPCDSAGLAHRHPPARRPRPHRRWNS